MEFIHHLRYGHDDEAGHGPEIDDMIAFSSRCPKLERREHSRFLFELCRFCLPHCNILYVGLSSGNGRERTVVLTSFSVPL